MYYGMSHINVYGETFTLRMRQQPKRHTTKQYMKEHIYAGFEARS